MKTNAHWTAGNNKAFLHAIAFDFIAQLQKRMEELPLKQEELAKKLGVTEGAVSKVLNNPQNLTMKTMVNYARAVGMKVAIVAYDDDDPQNESGPINSEVFSNCWENVGKPRDFWSLRDNISNFTVVSTQVVSAQVQETYNLTLTGYILSGVSAGMFQYTGMGATVGNQGIINVPPPLLMKGEVETYA